MFQIDKSLDDIIKDNKNTKKNVRRGTGSGNTKKIKRSNGYVKIAKKGFANTKNSNRGNRNARKVSNEISSSKQSRNIKPQKLNGTPGKRFLNTRRSNKFWVKDKMPEGKWKNDLYDGPNRKPKEFNAKASITTSPARLVVSNLDPGVTDSDIEELFSEFGPMKGASVHYDRFGNSRETADIVFQDEKDALNAVNKYNGIPLDGKPMDIQISISNQIYQESTNGSKPMSRGPRGVIQSPLRESRARSKSPFLKRRSKSPSNINRSRSKSPFVAKQSRNKGWSRANDRRSRSASRFQKKSNNGRLVGLGKKGEKITFKPSNKPATKEALDRQLSEYMK